MEKEFKKGMKVSFVFGDMKIYGETDVLSYGNAYRIKTERGYFVVNANDLCPVDEVEESVDVVDNPVDVDKPDVVDKPVKVTKPAKGRKK